MVRATGILSLVGAALLAWVGAVEEGAVEEEAARASGASRLNWLAGTWRGDFHGGVWESTYSTPEGGVVLGMSKLVTDGAVDLFEFERFFERGDDLVVQPYPRGRGSVLFELAEFDGEKRLARFVNEDHDFPKQLVYERRSEDTLVVRVLGDSSAEPPGFSLTLRRVD